MKKKSFWIFGFLISVLFLCAPDQSSSQAAAGKNSEAQIRRIRIVTSFYPIYIMALNLTKDVPGVSAANLTPSVTGCLHDYSLTAEDMKKISRADLFVANGAGMESFLEKVAKQFPRLKTVRLAEGMDLIDSRGEANSHVWVGLSGAMEEVRRLGDTMIRIDPSHAEHYRRNTEDYLTELAGLRDKMRAELAPYKGMTIITLHEAFPYFAREFGLNIAGVVEREPGSVPSAKEIAETIDLVRRTGVKVIFAEPQYPSAVAETIARETGAKVYTLDPAVTGPDDPGAYLQIMNQNLKILTRALAA